MQDDNFFLKFLKNLISKNLLLVYQNYKGVYAVSCN